MRMTKSARRFESGTSRRDSSVCVGCCERDGGVGERIWGVAVNDEKNGERDNDQSRRCSLCLFDSCRRKKVELRNGARDIAGKRMWMWMRRMR